MTPENDRDKPQWIADRDRQERQRQVTDWNGYITVTWLIVRHLGWMIFWSVLVYNVCELLSVVVK